MATNKEREMWVDIAKGIGIISVVMGHYVTIIQKYFYWFHMPLFFSLSGYFFTPLTSWKDFIQWTIKRSKQLLAPYFSFYIIITLFSYILNKNISVNLIVKDIMNGLYGGQMLRGLYSPFWFITCLLLTQIASAIIFLLFKNTLSRIIVFLTLFFLGHLQMSLLNTKLTLVPWGADIVLISIAYFIFGYYSKSIVANLHKNKLVSYFLLFFSMILILLDYIGIFWYGLNLKAHIYNNLILDLVIPILLISSICVVSQFLSKYKFSKILAQVGICSLVIMYLHCPINIWISKFFNYGFYFYTSIGIIIPSFISIIISKNNFRLKKISSFHFKRKSQNSV